MKPWLNLASQWWSLLVSSNFPATLLRKFEDQCCPILRFVTNLVTLDTNLLQKFCSGYLAFLANFESLTKNWFWTGLKPVWIYFLVLWCIYFCYLKELWCRYFGFSKIWPLMVQTFLQHCRFSTVCATSTVRHHI